MPEFVPVSPQRHQGKYWQRFTSYAFARTAAVVPLVGAEMAKAAAALPVAFMPDGEGDAARFVPAALLGFESNVNLFVAPDGRWLGRYIPSFLRGHPFRLINADQERMVLCIDESSGLLVDQGGEAFFDDQGQLAPNLQAVMDFLTQVERNRAATQAICDKLQQHELIQPWPIKIAAGDAGERNLNGLYRIDETALNQLSAEVLVELRDSGALGMAYCQLLAMQQLGLIADMAKAHQKQAVAANTRAFSLNDDNGNLRFD